MEIEGPNEDAVWNMIERIGLPSNKVTAKGAYEHYGIDSTELENLSFDMEKDSYLSK